MPLRLIDLAKSAKTAAFTYAGETVTLTYRLGQVTPRMLAEVATITDLSLIAERVASLVSAWDVEEKPGQPFPLTAERLAELPLHFLLTVLRQVVEDARPGEAAAPGSDGNAPASGATS